MSDVKWEEVTIDPKGAGHTYRIPVPGGFLYRTTTYRYPEKHRQWDILIAKMGGVVPAVRWCNERMANGFDAKWRSQAEEIVAQNTVFVPEPECDRVRWEERKIKAALERAREDVRQGVYRNYDISTGTWR